MTSNATSLFATFYYISDDCFVEIRNINGTKFQLFYEEENDTFLLASETHGKIIRSFHATSPSLFPDLRSSIGKPTVFGLGAALKLLKEHFTN